MTKSYYLQLTTTEPPPLYTCNLYCRKLYVFSEALSRSLPNSTYPESLRVSYVYPLVLCDARCHNCLFFPPHRNRAAEISHFALHCMASTPLLHTCMRRTHTHKCMCAYMSSVILCPLHRLGKMRRLSRCTALNADPVYLGRSKVEVWLGHSLVGGWYRPRDGV